MEGTATQNYKNENKLFLTPLKFKTIVKNKNTSKVS